MVSNFGGETFLLMQSVKCCTLLKWKLDLPFLRHNNAIHKMSFLRREKICNLNGAVSVPRYCCNSFPPSQF